MREVAVGILTEDGRVLICQRKRSARYPLKWEFPGGKLEPGESPKEALIRELREELSIDSLDTDFFFEQNWVYPESRTDGEFKVYYFLVHSFNGRPVNKAFEQMQWVPPPELLTMDILEGNREAVRLLVQNAKDDNRPG
jgi:8-oxo-dGTP diphosphatase